MKDLKRLRAAGVLVLALASPTFAGHIPCGATDPPPQQQQAAGEIPNPPRALLGALLTLRTVALP
jgi:hypothetical protein